MRSMDPGGLPELTELFTGIEPQELRGSYIAVAGPGLRVGGSAVPALGGFADVPSGFSVPVGTVTGPQPIDYAHVYMTLADYLPPSTPAGPLDPQAVAEQLTRGQERIALLVHLALLNGLTHQGRGVVDQLAVEYERFLEPTAAERCRNSRSRGREPHQFLARQPLLAAMRTVLVGRDPAAQEAVVPPIVAAVLLSHAVAVDLAADREHDDEMVGVPEHLFFEMLRLGPLYESEGMWESIDRHVRLWRYYGERLVRTNLRASPAELLVEATGLELEKILALGFALYAIAHNWKPGETVNMPAPNLGLGLDPADLDAFWSLVAASPEELSDEFEGHTASAFDFLPIQMRPVLRLPEVVIPLDIGYLWDRVTTGLYWMVHDAEKARGSRDRLRWTQGFAEAVELMVEDSVSQMAPMDLAGGTTWYTEEHFAVAYPDAKRPDAAIDFGDRILLIEIVSGALSVPTRIDGRRDRFDDDLERLVLKKCRQLDSAAQAVLHDSQALTGYPGPPGLRVIPAVVIGGGFPLNPLTRQYIEEKLSAEKLFEHPLVQTLSIIDLGDIEALEALAEKGLTPVDVLDGWQASGLHAVPFRNYLLTRWSGRDLRPSRMEAVHETFDTIRDVLQIRGHSSVDDPPSR